jgi:hypothetical protein
VYLYVHRYWKHLKLGKYSPPPKPEKGGSAGLDPAEAGI